MSGFLDSENDLLLDFEAKFSDLIFLQREELNLPPLQTVARLTGDVKAITTIAITIAAYFLCYLPSVVHALVGIKKFWVGFMAWYSLYISSAVNPIIYYLRNSRFRFAFKQFFKDPFGTSDLCQKPSGPIIGAKRKIEVRGRKTDGEKAVGACGVQTVDENQPRQTYSGERRNEILILSIECLQEQSCLHEASESGENGEAEEQKEDASESKRQMKGFCKKKKNANGG